MGKRLIHQRRGRGTPAHRVASHRFKDKIRYRSYDALEKEGSIKGKVIATPGHTKGSCCYYFEEGNLLISGDTLFQESVGRTDLPTGSGGTIIRSILGTTSRSRRSNCSSVCGCGSPTTTRLKPLCCAAALVMPKIKVINVVNALLEILLLFLVFLLLKQNLRLLLLPCQLLLQCF